MAKWVTSYDPKRWDQHTVNFPKFRSAVHFAHKWIAFDQACAIATLKDLMKHSEEHEDENEEQEEEEQDAVKDDDGDEDVDGDAD